jgi:predicted alpha/beta-fold hydrolase
VQVKYLGEEGAATPIGAAAAVCCPWDLVVCPMSTFLIIQ